MHPAIQLLLITALILFWLLPSSAWWMLRDARDDNARLWFSGTACYALSVTIFSLWREPGSAAVWASIFVLNIVSVLLMIESLRRELESGPVPWLAYAIRVVPPLILIVTATFLLGEESLARLIYLVYLGAIEIWLLALALRVKRRLGGRALDVMALVFGLFAVLNLARAAEALIVGKTAHVLSLTPLANVAVVMNFIGVVFYSFGYWGFSLEKTRRRAEASAQQLMEARGREQEARYRAALAAEREQLLVRMVRLGRLAQGGALSASVAHEINQPLASVRLNLESAIASLDALPEAEIARRFAERARNENQRAAEIILRIRKLFQTRNPVLSARVVDVIVERILNLFRKDQRFQGLTVTTSLNAKTPIEIAEGEFEHVLINLLNNAVDSIRATAASEQRIAVSTEQDDGVTRVRIADSGAGIPPELRSSLFDIAVSSKAEGTGMGLWLARYIVERHLGRLYLDEAVAGPGACFVIEIGAVPAEVGLASAVGSPGEAD